MLLHEVIEGPLARRAGSPAVIDAETGETVSYLELSRRARAYAKWFLDLGFGAGDRVGIVARKSPNVIAAFLGASRAGVVYVPLDVQASPAYWVSVLEELQVGHVLSNVDGVGSKLAGFRVHDLGAGGQLDGGSPGDDVNVSDAARTPDGDAYILATSGSTGRPKGVLLSHRNALAFVEWAAREVVLGPEDRLLSVAPFHFDLSVFDIYGALSSGACVVLAPGMAALFPGELIATIDSRKISILYTVPTVLRGLMEASAFKDGAGGSLRSVIYAGEAFPAADVGQLMAALPGVTHYNFFGPTETNVSLAHRLDGRPDVTGEVPIGKPASGARIKLVDKTGGEVGVGEIGEIVVDGPTVMKGYVRASGFELARRPFATGDYGQQGPDGTYYFRGRRDAQVKVRGARVELASVERALKSADGVVESVALVVGRDLVGFVGGDSGLLERALRGECAKSLPPGAVPHRIVILRELPRLSNGKLDLAQLKAIAGEQRPGGK